MVFMRNMYPVEIILIDYQNIYILRPVSWMTSAVHLSATSLRDYGIDESRNIR